MIDKRPCKIHVDNTKQQLFCKDFYKCIKLRILVMIKINGTSILSVFRSSQIIFKNDNASSQFGRFFKCSIQIKYLNDIIT